MPYKKGKGPSVVIALGGNALGNTPQEQLELVKDTATHIVDMIGEGVNVVVSHGNGPQVGMINNAFAYAAANDGKTPEMPFPEAGAMSQGYIGYQLSQAILNELKERGIMRSTACIVTQTVVDANDPAFQNPTKPVGAFLSEEEAKAKADETGWTFKEDAGRGWRQVVASPKPVRIVEFDAIKDLMDDGYVVVSTGLHGPGPVRPRQHAAQGGGLHRVRPGASRGQGAHHLARVRRRGPRGQDGHRHHRVVLCLKLPPALLGPGGSLPERDLSVTDP